MDDLTLRKYLRNDLSEQQLVEVLDWLDASAENRQRLDRLDYVSNIGILFGEAGSRVFPRPMSPCTGVRVSRREFCSVSERHSS